MNSEQKLRSGEKPILSDRGVPIGVPMEDGVDVNDIQVEASPVPPAAATAGVVLPPEYRDEVDEKAKTQKKNTKRLWCCFVLGVILGVVIFVGLVFLWMQVIEWTGLFKEEVIFDDGIRTILFEDGTVYTGTLHNDLPDGMGTAKQTDGTAYDGQWRAGQREGFGTETLAESKDQYIGEWKNDNWEGEGILLFGATGNRYAGQF